MYYVICKLAWEKQMKQGSIYIGNVDQLHYYYLNLNCGYITHAPLNSLYVARYSRDNNEIVSIYSAVIPSEIEQIKIIF